MACYHPIPAFMGADGVVVFAERTRHASIRSLFLPCGQCIGCRLERSRQWAVRCMHEASLYDRNCFITLTYDDENCPRDLSLRKRDFQKFMKRLRKRIRPQKVRYYMCGEYGEDFSRPHYHACLFNYDFPDKLYFKKAGEGKLYTSNILETLWPWGYCLIGQVTFESAAYVARYCTKKITGKAAENHYRLIHPDTGEIHYRTPEYNQMSLRPAIGRPWLDRFFSDVYPKGVCVVNAKTVKPPRYYDKVFKKLLADDTDYAQMMLRRETLGKEMFDDNTDDRLAVKEQVAEAQMKQKKRSL